MPGSRGASETFDLPLATKPGSVSREQPFYNARSGRVTLAPTYGAGVTLFLAGDSDQQPAVGGWADQPRHKRLPASWFRGVDESGTMSLTVAVDQRLDPVAGTVGQVLSRLRLLGKPHGDHERPPRLKVISAALPLAQDGYWVIQAGGLQLGGHVVIDGVLVRQDVSLQLRRWQKSEGLNRVTVRATRDQRNRRRTRIIQTRNGDTLRAIAVRQLGNASEWPDIRRANKQVAKVDPDEPLRAGIRLKLK